MDLKTQVLGDHKMTYTFCVGRTPLPNVKLLCLKEVKQVNTRFKENVILHNVYELGVDVNNKHIGLMGNSISANLQMKRDVPDLLKQEMPPLSFNTSILIAIERASSFG